LMGKKAASKKAAARKAAAKKAPMTTAAPKNVTARNRSPEKASVKKAAPKKVAPKKQAAVPKPRQAESLMAGAEVPRKFTMTVLSKIPAKIHEELVDNESIYKGMFNKRAEIHFIGVLNDPKNPTRAGVVDFPNLWEWRPAER
jgi:hypothetical protein